MGCAPENIEQAKANAAHIVKCVNSYDDQIASLKCADKALTQITIYENGNRGASYRAASEAIGVIREALKNAGHYDYTNKFNKH